MLFLVVGTPWNPAAAFAGPAQVMAASVANLLPERRHYECGCEILRERVQRLVDPLRDGVERAGGAKASCAAQASGVTPKPANGRGRGLSCFTLQLPVQASLILYANSEDRI
jgi:hypothetical protein